MFAFNTIVPPTTNSTILLFLATHWLWFVLATIAIVAIVLMSHAMKRFKTEENIEAHTEEMVNVLTKKPVLDLQFEKIRPEKKDLPQMMPAFLELGYKDWFGYFTPQLSLNVFAATHENGSLCVVYHHMLLGTWFEAFVKTPSKLYHWSSSPIANPQTHRSDVVFKHHKLMTRFDVQNYITDVLAHESDVFRFNKKDVIPFLQNEYKKNTLHLLAQPLSDVYITSMFPSFKMKANPKVVNMVKNSAQGPRLQVLEGEAWKAVGGDYQASEGFVVHPYSVVSEDIFALYQTLNAENLAQALEEDAQELPENFIHDLQQIVPQSQVYKIIRHEMEPFETLLIARKV